MFVPSEVMLPHTVQRSSTQSRNGGVERWADLCIHSTSRVLLNIFMKQKWPKKYTGELLLVWCSGDGVVPETTLTDKLMVSTCARQIYCTCGNQAPGGHNWPSEWGLVPSYTLTWWVPTDFDGVHLLKVKVCTWGLLRLSPGFETH